MPKCSIEGCKTTSVNAKERNLKLFSFPKNLEIREKWISACKKPYRFNDDNARICSKHFTEEEFEKPLIQKMLNYSPVNSRKLKTGAIPSLYLPPFAESEVKIEKLCAEIENIPIDDSTDSSVEIIPDFSSESPKAVKKVNSEARLTYEHLISTYMNLTHEKNELKSKNKVLKLEYDKQKKLYEKRLLENVKLRQKNKFLMSENLKLRNRLKKLENKFNLKSECIVDDSKYVENKNYESDEEIFS